jgi:hypothetical protein
VGLVSVVSGTPDLTLAIPDKENPLRNLIFCLFGAKSIYIFAEILEETFWEEEIDHCRFMKG